MKKHSPAPFLPRALIACLSVLFASGCVSAPLSDARHDPLDYFSREHVLYLRVPAALNEELTGMVIRDTAPFLSAQDAERLLSLFDTLYIGIGPEKGGAGVFYEIVADGSFPPAVMSAVFTKRNGWIKETDPASGRPIFVHTRFPLQVSPVSADRLCVSVSVGEMLKAERRILPAAACAVTAQPGQENRILFYSSSDAGLPFAGSGGIELTAVSSVSGSMAADTDSKEGGYILSADIVFSDTRAVRPVAFLLNLALGGTAAVEQAEENIIRIEGIRMPVQAVSAMIQAALSSAVQ